MRRPPAASVPDAPLGALVRRARRLVGSIARRLGFVSLSVGLVASGALLHAACEDVTAKGHAAPHQRAEDLADVLARVDDTVITVGDFQQRINKQSPYVRARYTSLERKKEFLDNLVRFEVLANEAHKRGLDKDPEVVLTMKQVMIQKLMKDAFDQNARPEDVSDADCRAYFDKHPEEFNKAAEARVALILVKDEKTAKKVLADPRIHVAPPSGQAQAKPGTPPPATDVSAGFRQLVAEYSIDQATKDRGGDLRYFDANTKELPPAIVQAAFALEKIGDVSPPIKTPQGWNVLMLTGQHKAITRSFDDVKGQIRNKLFRDRRQQGMEDFVSNLRKQATVEIHEDKLAKVVIEGGTSGAMNAPGVPPPGPGMFHPPGQSAPQAGPTTPGQPPGVNQIVVPGPKATPEAPPEPTAPAQAPAPSASP